MYWIDASTQSNSSRQFQFFMDTDADKNNLPTSTTPGVQQGDDEVSCLPCGKGSTVLSIESGKAFILNSSDVWVQIGG